MNVRTDTTAPRLRVPGKFPNKDVTGAEIDRLREALLKRGVEDNQFRIEAVLIYDPAVEKEAQAATYDV